MPAKRGSRVPAYCRHRRSGRAYVTIDGREIYLGEYGSDESHEQYQRVIAEWKAAGRSLPAPAADLTIVELAAQFVTHARAFYRNPDGTPSREAQNNAEAIKPLVDLYGETLVKNFTALSLKAVVVKMVEKRWCRNRVNRQASRLKHIFKWGCRKRSCRRPCTPSLLPCRD